MKYLLLLHAVLLITACKQNNTALTSGHLPPKKMEQILYDMQLADVYSSSVVVDSVHRFGNRNMDSLAIYYNEILKHHGTTYEAFNESIAWYKENPVELDSVYTRVLNKISIEGTKYGEH
jgi:hypothetical protein